MVLPENSTLFRTRGPEVPSYVNGPFEALYSLVASLPHLTYGHVAQETYGEDYMEE